MLGLLQDWPSWPWTWFGWVLGAILVVLGVLGYALVQTRACPSSRSRRARAPLVVQASG
ncbi:hypothetical protein QJS66_17655 [Kocuria rhizophila]|nr:hypothetical protein QJS66_17655 [Kocuria rhizophila]